MGRDQPAGEESIRMPKPIRLGIVGAGSAQFSLGLVRDLCLTPSMSGSLVSLMDIDAERVAMVQSIARRYAAELSFDLRFEATTSREEALDGADFVINTASVGAHGGGGFASVHNLRFMVSVARDMERLCPNAWLIQSGNPVFEGCTAMTRATSTKVVGLCHGHYGVYEMARVLGLAAEDISWQAVGFNHVIFLTHFYHKGEDAYPLLDRWIEEKAEEYWRTYKPRFSENQMSRSAIQQYRMLGIMPIGDTPRAGGWWYHKDLAAKKQWYGHLGGFDSCEGWAIYIAELEEARAAMFRVAADPAASVTRAFPPAKSKEQLVPIMDALTNDVSGYFQVNIPNNRLIWGLPDDIVVEVPALVSKRGVQGIQVGRMPDGVMSQIMWPRLAQAERHVAFARAPGRGLLLDLILYRHTEMWNGHTPPVASFEDAEAEMARLLAEDGELAALLA
jgi:alpha-galactosidase